MRPIGIFLFLLAFLLVTVEAGARQAPLHLHSRQLHIGRNIGVLLLLSLPLTYGVPFSTASEPLVYKSGKNPVPVDKNDPKAGTRKDTKFLRCLSNCKSKSEQPTSGLAANRYDSIQVCQDQCCETYEQCSFKINIGSSSTGGV